VDHNLVAARNSLQVACHLLQVVGRSQQLAPALLAPSGPSPDAVTY
jgi:hypothetical protein